MMTPFRSALVAMLAALLLLPPSSRADDKSESRSSTKRATVAVFNLDGPITEKPAVDDPLFGSINSESLQSLVARIDKAAEDDAVEAAVFLLGHTSFGKGQMAEIREAMDRFKKAGKPIYAHADSLSMGRYTFLSGASRLSVSPVGDLWITGLYGEQPYLRGLFDMIGVKPDFLTCGDYKSAAEMFMRSGPSDEAAEMYGWLYDGIYEASLKHIAEGRGVEAEQAREWVNEGLYSSESAQEKGLIDAVETRDEFVAHIKEQHGKNLKFDKEYGEDKGQTIDFNNPFAVFQLWAELLTGPQTRKSTKDAVAVVYVEGPIMPGSPQPSPFGTMSGAYSEPIRKALDDCLEDETIKAVVLRVNSPGGSAVASEIIMQATRRVKAEKPLVVSMGDVAGSGGYYVACGSDVIFADEATITGSIGVVAGKLATTDMWNKVGITWHPIQRGEKASLLSSAAVFTDDERDNLQSWMNEVYEVFKGHVTAIRGEKLTKPIDEIAGGRVYTGKQALDLGLVDRLGGLDAAIDYAAEQAGLDDDYEIRAVPRPKNFIELLFADLAPQKDKDEGDLRLSTRLLDAALPALQAADPARVKQIREALLQLDILQQERVMLTMPIIRFHD